MRCSLAIAFLGICLAACIAAPAPGSRQCSSNGICLKIEVSEPIRINEPMTLTTTLTSDKDFSRVQVAFSSDAPDLLIEDKQSWQKGTLAERIDLIANQPVSVSRRLLVSRERRFNVVVSAMAPSFRVVDTVYIIVDEAGGKIYRSGEVVPPAPFRRLPTVTPGGPSFGPLTPPSMLAPQGPQPPAGGSAKPIEPTAPPPTWQPSLLTPTRTP
jgi:hypothetical protein